MFFINIHLNKLQIKTKQRLQNLKHYEKLRRNKKTIHQMFKKNTENRSLFRQSRKKLN